jgi:transcription-repair coupling factor (superfamily II helicase)
MPLRAFLSHLEHDPTASRLADEGGSAFVSQSLRPFLLAALADRDVRRPTVVVAGDDRSARDLAADLRAWLRPRPVRFYPSRGVAYESHLTPPPHLVGLRVAALDALLDRNVAEGERPRRSSSRLAGETDFSEQPVVVVSAVALSEKVPDPKLRPHGFTLRVGELLDLDEAAADLVAAGYERVDQVEERGQFAVRGGLLDVYPATEERAVRVDLFDDEIESLRWFSTFTQRSLGDADVVEIAPAAELAPEHRELAEIAALENPDERPDIAELLPVGEFRELLDLVPERAQVIVAADEDVEPALRDHWQDVCAAFHDTDAHHLYVKPDGILAALERDASVRLSSISGSQPVEIRAQAAEFASRSLREAEPELEKLVRSGYTTVVAWPQRGAAERAAYNLGRAKASLDWDPAHHPDGTELVFVESTLRDGFLAPQLKLAVVPEHRLIHRRKRAGGARSPTCARATSSSTRTTESRASPASTPRRSRASRATTSTSSTRAPTRSSCRSTSSRRSPATSAPTARTRRCPSSAARAGRGSRRAPAAPPRSSPASCSTSTRSASAAAATRSSPIRTGCASSRAASPTARRPTSATRSRRSRRTWSPSARWTG